MFYFALELHPNDVVGDKYIVPVAAAMGKIDDTANLINLFLEILDK